MNGPALEEKIGYVFENKELLREALTHSSYANEQVVDTPPSYERIEFLGDALLGFVCGEYLLDKYPAMNEGDLTQTRSRLVCEASLADVGREMDIMRHIIVGKGEEQSGGRKRPALVADVVEALIGAIYRDGGLEAAKTFIHRFVLTDENDRPFVLDAKSLAQEYVAKGGLGKLSYELAGVSGPGHSRDYHVDLYLNGKKIGSGSGKSKKSAEQQAAQQALPQLTPPPAPQP